MPVKAGAGASRHGRAEKANQAAKVGETARRYSMRKGFYFQRPGRGWGESEGDGVVLPGLHGHAQAQRGAACLPEAEELVLWFPIRLFLSHGYARRRRGSNLNHAVH